MRAGATVLAGMLMLTAALGLVRGARADEAPDTGLESTPPRLSLTDGQVSFWRPGAPDWTQAQVNTPLAPGDALSTGSPGTLEIQIGARAFVRAWGNTQIALGAQEPDFIQFTLAAGSAVFDLRALDPGDTVEIDTPNAAVTIEQPGYYRVDVTGDRSRIMTREGGRATVTPAGGQAVTVTPSEELVVEGTSSAQLAAYAAPPLDDWDRWNYCADRPAARCGERAIRLSRHLRPERSRSVRHVARGADLRSRLGADGRSGRMDAVQHGLVGLRSRLRLDLGRHGAVGLGSLPLTGAGATSTGTGPGRPGRSSRARCTRPRSSRSWASPARSRSGAAGLPVSWVALGWGEPVVPWWGRRGRGHGPSWRGWGGPRVVNNVVVSNTTVVNVQNITVYRNASVPHAVVAVDRARFGHGPITGRRIAQVDGQRLRPLPGAPQISAHAGEPGAVDDAGHPAAAGALRRLEVAPERVRRGREAPSPYPSRRRARRERPCRGRSSPWRSPRRLTRARPCRAPLRPWDGGAPDGGSQNATSAASSAHPAPVPSPVPP